MNPTQAINEFDARHGGPSVAVQSTNGTWLLYPDGARRETNPYGRLIDPPSAEMLQFYPYNGNQDRLDREALDCRIDYWEAKVHHLVKAHEQLRNSMMGNDYSDDQLKELERLMDAVKVARQALDELKDERSENPAVKEFEAGKEAEAERQQRIKDKTAALNKMKV